MTLLDAKEINPEESHKSKRRITIAVSLLIAVLGIGVLGFLLGDGWWFSYWPDEHVVGTLFSTLQKQDYKTAYGIWWHDPNWEQHPELYTKKYPYNEFYRDWGPGGEWGLIKTYKVFGASTCPSQGGGASSGVLVDVVVNDRSQHAQVWRDHQTDHALGFPPCELIFR